MLVRIANREDPDQTASSDEKQSDLGLHCLSMPFFFADNYNSVLNFRTSTIKNVLILVSLCDNNIIVLKYAGIFSNLIQLSHHFGISSQI